MFSIVQNVIITIICKRKKKSNFIYVHDAPNPIKEDARYKHHVSWKKKFPINKLEKNTYNYIFTIEIIA